MAKRLGMPKRLRWERKTTQSAKAKLNRAEGQIVSRRARQKQLFLESMPPLLFQALLIENEPGNHPAVQL